MEVGLLNDATCVACVFTIAFEHGTRQWLRPEATDQSGSRGALIGGYVAELSNNKGSRF